MRELLNKTSFNICRIRNIGISAHVDAGKTTLTERVLFYTGSKHAVGNVDDGNTTTDFTKQEMERGITIQSAAVTCSWKDHQINLIDTPGHVDFTIEVERSMRVLDGAVIVICAKGGVQPQTKTVWRQANRHRVPRIAFINKMDSPGANFDRVTCQIVDELKIKPAILQLPIGESTDFRGVVDVLEQQALVWQSSDKSGMSYSCESVPESLKAKAQVARTKLIEDLAEEDESIMNSYLENRPISNDQIKQALRKATLEQKMMPVFCGTALQSIAIQPLLDAICHFLPAPNEREHNAYSHCASDADKCEQAKSANESLVALAFKVVDDPYGDLVFVRIYEGQMKSGSYAFNSRTGKQERISRLVRVHGAKQLQVESLNAGEIGAVIGLKETVTGDTLCTKEFPVTLEPISYPEPVIAYAVEPADRSDEARMTTALQRMQKADPSFRFWTDTETGQTIIAGMGELHLQIKQELLAEQGIQTRCGKPDVSYRETVCASARADYTHKKQSGGPGQYARVVLQVEPGTQGSGIQFIDRTVGGAIPRQFLASVEKGIREATTCGPLKGYPVVDIVVTLLGGQSHETDSNDLSFKTAAAQAFKEAFTNASPTMLEPVMSLEVEVPAGFTGSAIGDICQRKGQVISSTVTDQTASIVAEIPLAKTFGYSTALRSLSSGQGTFTLEFVRYARMIQD